MHHRLQGRCVDWLIYWLIHSVFIESLPSARRCDGTRQWTRPAAFVELAFLVGGLLNRVQILVLSLGSSITVGKIHNRCLPQSPLVPTSQSGCGLQKSICSIERFGATHFDPFWLRDCHRGFNRMWKKLQLCPALCVLPLWLFLLLKTSINSWVISQWFGESKTWWCYWCAARPPQMGRG